MLIVSLTLYLLSLFLRFISSTVKKKSIDPSFLCVPCISTKTVSGTLYLTELCTYSRSCNFDPTSCTIQGNEGKKSQGSQHFFKVRTQSDV